MGQLLLFICTQNHWLSQGEPGLILVLTLNTYSETAEQLPAPSQE